MTVSSCMAVAALLVAVTVPPGGNDRDGDPPLGEPLVLYVAAHSPPRGDGLSWATAFRHLQDGLAAAREQPSVKEIRVAQGVYKPDRGEGMEQGDIEAMFELVDGVALRGGYAGPAGADPDARNIEAFATTLSGDLLADDTGIFENVEDNSYRVVSAIEVGPATVLDGLFFTASQWNIGYYWVGGGLHCASGELIVQNCRFHRCLAYRGGGIGVELEAAVTVRSCIFRSNRAIFGACISTSASGPGDPHVLIEDCIFADNRAHIEHAGGVYAGSRTVIRRCDFVENTSGNDAGAIYGSPVVEDCRFINNACPWGGGAVLSFSGGTFRRCLFEGNYAGAGGGAIAGTGSFVDCTFLHNVSCDGGAVIGAGSFINCRFLGNEAITFDHGGGIYVGGPALIVNCTFSGNHADGAGGAIRVAPDESALIINCAFSRNTSDMPGSAIEGPADIINCVMWDNPGVGCAGVQSVSYSCVPSSCSELGPGNIVEAPLFVDADGPDDITGNDDDDLRLMPGSPCIDAGDTTALPADELDLDGDGDLLEPLPLDLHGNARVLDLPPAPDGGVAPSGGAAIVDMGAYEHRRAADVAPLIGDGVVDVGDLITVIASWGPCPQQDGPGDQPPCAADIDADGAVGVADLLAVLLQWD